jgi:hypothetical protein
MRIIELVSLTDDIYTIVVKGGDRFNSESTILDEVLVAEVKFI